MSVYRNLLAAAAANIARYRTRSLVVVTCLVAICGPYVAGIAISEGIRADAEISVEEGPDLYLTMDQFGRNGPVPLKYLDAFRKSPSITAVEPRIVGRADALIAVPETQTVDSQLVVILGLESKRSGSPPLAQAGIIQEKGDSPHLPERPFGCSAQMGTVPFFPPRPQHNGEVVIGAALADYFGLRAGEPIRLKVGDVIMPFRVAAVLPGNATIWSAQLVSMTLDDAGKLFALPGFATDFLIRCRPGPGDIQAVRQDAYEILGDIPYRLQTRHGEVAAYIDKGFRHQQGIFTVLFLVAFAVGIPALLVASGLGLSERRREIGVCKAVGWQTTDVMLMITFEQVLLSIIAACATVLVAYVWVRLLNGVVVAQFFISGLGTIAPFQVPARFTPAAAGLALLLCLSITLVGGLLTTWRTATRLPAESTR